MTIFLMCFGPPTVAQMDNGKEFKGLCLILLKRFGIPIVNGRPRRPQTQGLVEQANGVAKTKLAVYLRELGTTAWAAALPVIAMSMNSQPHKSLPRRMTPYQVMFSRRIVNLAQVDHTDRLELFAISDDVIDQYCSANPPKESHPVLDRFIEQTPINADCDDQGAKDEDKDQDEDEDDVDKAAIIKQVKELKLRHIVHPNINPRVFVGFSEHQHQSFLLIDSRHKYIQQSRLRYLACCIRACDLLHLRCQSSPSPRPETSFHPKNLLRHQSHRHHLKKINCAMSL